MDKEAIIAEPPEQTTAFHTTAPARMSGRMECHRHCLVNYIHPIKTDHELDAQRHQKLVQSRDPSCRSDLEGGTGKMRSPPPPSSPRRLHHHPHCHHHPHHLFSHCNLKNPKRRTTMYYMCDLFMTFTYGVMMIVPFMSE
jgi:hypothetical protein